MQYARELSGRNAQARGRAPTLNTLTTLLVAVSMTEIWLSPSEVTYTNLPSGLVVTPSGSSPTGMVADNLSAGDVDDAGLARVFVRHEDLRAVGAQRDLLWIGSAVQHRHVTFRCAMSKMPMPSAVLSAGGSLLSSTPGPRNGRAAERDEQLRAVRAHLDAARPFAERNGCHGLVRAAVDDRQIAAWLVRDIDVVRRLRRFGAGAAGGGAAACCCG